VNPIGHRLREARLARGMTQEQLAQGLATKGFISQVERNHATPSLAKLRLLAERLSLPLATLTGDATPLEVSYLRKSAELAVRAAEPARAVALLDEASAQPMTANERADLSRIRGTALDALGRLDEALDAHQQAAANAPLDDPELNAAIYAEIATVLNQQEKFNAAVEAGLRAVQWMDRARAADPALRSRILSNLGRSCYGLGQLDRSHSFYTQALAAAMDAESLYRIANAHMSLGVTARAAGKLDDAIEHCNRALEIWSRINQERFANRVLNNLGDVLWTMGRKSEARKNQARCVERARELNDVFEVGVAGAELARYALEDGNFQAAIVLARESQPAARAATDHLHLAYALGIEAAAAQRLGHPLIADRKFRTACELLLDRNATGKLAQVCAMYADALRGRGQHDRAFALMRLAAERDFSKLPAIIRTRK
jgi:transcriptional regulator with XRE-family HTH domain